MSVWKPNDSNGAANARNELKSQCDDGRVKNALVAISFKACLIASNYMHKQWAHESTHPYRTYTNKMIVHLIDLRSQILCSHRWSLDSVYYLRSALFTPSIYYIYSITSQPLWACITNDDVRERKSIKNMTWHATHVKWSGKYWSFDCQPILYAMCAAYKCSTGTINVATWWYDMLGLSANIYYKLCWWNWKIAKATTSTKNIIIYNKR